MSWLAYVHCMDVLLSKPMSELHALTTTCSGFLNLQVVSSLISKTRDFAQVEHEWRSQWKTWWEGRARCKGAIRMYVGTVMWWCREDESATSRSAATWSHLHCWEVWAGLSRSRWERGNSQQHCHGSAHRKGCSVCCGKKKNFRKQLKRKMYGVQSLF